MTDIDWHAPPALLARFAQDPDALDGAAAASVEAHLVACAECRARLAQEAPDELVANSWAAVADRIDRPRPALLERILRGLGLSEVMARLLAATASLQLAGLASIAAIAGGAAALARSADATGPFLVVAPLAPLVAVAAAFAPTFDPAGEAGLATPLHGAGLLIRRAAVVGITAFVVLGVASLAVPSTGPVAAAWVLPSLALTLGTVALSTWWRVDLVAGVLSGGWLLTIALVRWSTTNGLAYADSPAFTDAGQLTALALAASAAVVVVVRRDHLATTAVPR